MGGVRGCRMAVSPRIQVQIREARSSRAVKKAKTARRLEGEVPANPNSYANAAPDDLPFFDLTRRGEYSFGGLLQGRDPVKMTLQR
jgi:hypothetical protein